MLSTRADGLASQVRFRRKSKIKFMGKIQVMAKNEKETRASADARVAEATRVASIASVVVRSIRPRFFSSSSNGQDCARTRGRDSAAPATRSTMNGPAARPCVRYPLG